MHQPTYILKGTEDAKAKEHTILEPQTKRPDVMDEEFIHNTSDTEVSPGSQDPNLVPSESNDSFISQIHSSLAALLNIAKSAVWSPQNFAGLDLPQTRLGVF